VVVSPGFKRILCERGVPESKIEVIYNWANEEHARSREDSDLAAFGLNGRFNVIYAGNLGAAQGLETVLRAAKIVEDAAPDVQFILVGTGIEADRLRSLAAELAARSIRIMPPMPPSEIGNLLAAGDVLLVHLSDEPLFRITIPAKTQFYLAMGKPVLMGVRGDAAEMIEKAGAGVVVEPEDVRALADAVLALARLPSLELAAMGERGRNFYDRELSAAIGVERTLAVLASTASVRKRGLILKRVFDVSVAGAALGILTPIILITAAVLRLDHRSSVLFRQTRPGRHGKPFCLYKLRTMTDVFEKSGQPLPDAKRLTPLARFVRRMSLDELPQLWNVLRGDMSLVGPRPLLMAYLDRYTPEQARRHEVKPGITGWAQVNGRNAISWEQKLDLDVWYVKNRSLALDLKILALTVVRVLRRQGISAPGYDTMPEFRGTLDPWNEPNTPGSM
jgi:lipopolysaccharide/colanic/teichoic acid biosynthesis glycosyltransferase